MFFRLLFSWTLGGKEEGKRMIREREAAMGIKRVSGSNVARKRRRCLEADTSRGGKTRKGRRVERERDGFASFGFAASVNKREGR